jgi:hypothetical protein
MFVWQKKLKRLRAMTPAEVIYRMLTVMRDRAEYRRLKHGRLTESIEAFLLRLGIQGESGAALDLLLINLRGCSVFPWQTFPEDDLFKAYHHCFKDNLAVTLQAAQNAAAHRFSIFGTPLFFEGQIDWFYDPFLKRSLKPDYWKKIDYYSPVVVKEIKFLWELNRHRHFITLAKAWFLTRDDDYAHALADQWRDWLLKNPYLMGVNWSSALECAFRLISWTWALQFVKNSRFFSAELYGSVLQSVEKHVYYILSHLSRYSSANNHLLGEALGLIYAGCYYPEFVAASHWREKGFALFFDHFLAQVQEDGVGREQSTCYHNYVFEFGVLARLAAEHAGVRFPESVNSRLEKMAEVAHALCDHSYTPNIGDEDGGTAILISEKKEQNSERILSIAAVVLNRPEFCRKKCDYGESAFWLSPESTIRMFEGAKPQEPLPLLHHFADGGYIVVNQLIDRVPYKLIMDCAPIGLGQMAAHGHADALSIWLSVGGEPVLIDSGTFLYLGAGEERSYFRGTRAHNTICIDGRDSAEQLGPFQWGRRPRVILEEIRKSEPIYFRASHDGYHLMKTVREVEIQQNTLNIRDSVKGVGNHRIDVYFHLAPGSIERVSNRVICRYHHCRVDFSFESTAVFDLSLETAFYSPRFNEKKEHTVIRFSSTAELPITMKTIIGVYEKD